MKILLVNPPKSTQNLIFEYAPEDLKEQLKKIGIIGPPLSLCSLAGNLRDFDVEIFDLKAEYDLGVDLKLDEAMMRKLTEFKPDIVGVTVLTSDYNRAVRILELSKEFNPSILTVAGGIHTSLCPEHFDLPFIDICILGPGKKIFRDIVIELKNKGNFSEIPNLMIHRDGQRYFTKRTNIFEKKENLLSNVYANRELVRKYGEAYRVGKDHKIIGMIETSLGCGSRCSFCSVWPVNGGNYFTRSIEDVIGELHTMDSFEFMRFADANTMGDLEHTSLLFDRMIEEGFQKEIVMDVRADTAVYHPELIAKAAKAGLKVAIVGIESDNPEELEFYNKDSSTDITLRALEVFSKYNIDVRGICIIQPSYGENDFFRLKSFLDANNLSHSAFSIMTPFPGTELYNQMKDQIIEHNLDYYNLFNSVFKTRLPENEFYALCAEMFRGKKGIR